MAPSTDDGLSPAPGGLTPPIATADRKNDAELTTNDTSRPSHDVTSPPTAAPTASIVDHVAADSELARTRSAGATTAGSIAERAGSKNEVPTTANPINAYASHTVSALRTPIRPSTTSPRTMSAAIITRRRSSRSTSTPAHGPITADGSCCTTNIAATLVAVPVRSSSNAYTATVLNQSPSWLTTWPAQSRRKSRFARSSPV